MKPSTTFFSGLSILAFIACSSSTEPQSSSPARSLTASEEVELATQYCDSTARPACFSPDVAALNREACIRGHGLCVARTFTPAAVAEFGQCMKQQTCALDSNGNCDCGGESDDAVDEDTCFRDVGKAQPASPVRDAYVAACMTRFSECGKGSRSFADDWCTTGGTGFELYTDAIYEELTPCFQSACGDGTISNCLREKLTELSRGACTFED